MRFGYSSTRVDLAVTRGAAIVVVLGIGTASILVPAGVDDVATSTAAAMGIVRSVAEHPFATRLGYFLVVAALLAIGPATRRFRDLTRESAMVDLGWRLLTLGAMAGAVGNAFAPLTLPSTVGYAPETMAGFVHTHETSPASIAILGMYSLLSIGSVPYAIGLWRARAVRGWQALALGIGLGSVMPAPLGIIGIVLSVVLAAGLLPTWSAVAPSNP